MKVAILTMFSGLSSTYSLVNVVADQIAQDYVRHLQDVDVCIMHDILYQGWHLMHNVAIRRAQKSLPGVRFLAFTHSLPVKRPKVLEEPFSARFTPMPNTRFVYPSCSGLEALARQYDVPLGSCAAVYNTLPLLEQLSPDAQRVSHAAGLLSADIVAVYPARLTPGKRFEKVAALGGAIARGTELRVKVIFCDFPCADIPGPVYKRTIAMEGRKFGLEEGDVLFTSDLGYEQGFPRQGVFDLFTLSDLFVCPSYSESFGLTVLEAASRGNFLVLNEAVPALKELGDRLGAYFMRWDARNFGYDTRERYVPSEQAYYEEHGRAIVDLMREDRSLRAKTRTRTLYNGAWICRNQLMPLLTAAP